MNPLSLLFFSFMNYELAFSQNRRLLLHPDQPPASPAPPPITGHHGPRQPEPVLPPHLGGAPAMEPTSPPINGAYGQDCTPASGDFPDACKNIGEILTSTLSKIECIHNHDCCICGQMICGPDCTDLICNGDSSCFGVKYIELIGGSIGASINCNGDVSCMQTNIVGTNIRQMACTGDWSCAYSKFYLQCKGEKFIDGCRLECVGDDACKGHPTDPTQKAVFEVSGSFGMLCSHDSCRDAVFHLMNNYGGSIVCGAEAACTHSTITVNNVAGLLCGGEFGCFQSDILITNPQNGFAVVCTGFAACRGLNLEILVTDPTIEWFREIRCNSAHSCQGMTVSINKMVGPEPAGGWVDGSAELVIEELHCGQRESCRNAMFDLGPGVHFDNCGCAGGLTLACDNLLGVSSCVHGLGKLECVGTTSCAGLTEVITNPLNDFELVCNDAGSCSNFHLTINVDGTKPVSHFKGIKCGSPFACTGLTVNVNNIGRKRLDAGNLACDSSNACKNVRLNYYNADIGSVHCGDSTSCKGCTTTIDGICNQCSSGAACFV